MNKDKFGCSGTDDICLFPTPEEYVLFVHIIADCSQLVNLVIMVYTMKAASEQHDKQKCTDNN